MAAADDAESDSVDDELEQEEDEAAAPKEALKPGMARIVRDAQGNVVSIIVGTADGAEVEEKVHAPDRTGESSDEDEDEDDEEDEAAAAAAAVKKGKKGEKRGKAKGKGRAQGADEDEATPWGRPMKDWDAAPAVESDFGATEGVAKAQDVRQGIPIFGADRSVEAKTDVVRGASPLSLPSLLLAFENIADEDLPRPPARSPRGARGAQDQGDPAHVRV